MSAIHLVRDYAAPPAKLWRALTDPEQMAKWMIEAQPEGFAPEVGRRFRFVGAPRPGWSGIVEGEVLEVRAPSLLRYTWVADGETMEVTYRVEARTGGTRFTFDHDGFRGVGGFFARWFITGVRKKMFGERLERVIAELHS